MKDRVMITTAKKNDETTEQNLVPKTEFMLLSGQLVEEEPVLYNKAFYVSKEDHNKYGKKETYGSKTNYYLKQFRGGRTGELLVDPYGMFARAEDLSVYTTQKGHRFCEYVKVDQVVFETYVNYLQGRNPINFRFCERYILDRSL